jgi:hypothetical protein
VGVTIYVQDYLGEKLLRGSLDVSGVLAAAEEHGLPFLTSVDVYDDTTFNRRQSARLAEELDILSGSQDGLAEAIASLHEAIDMVGERAHRYLVFNGD